MEDHLVLYVDRLAKPKNAQAEEEEEEAVAGAGSSSGLKEKREVEESGGDDDDDEGEPLIQAAECRICQEEDCVMSLEVPCGCSGSLKVIKFVNFGCIIYVFVLF